MVGRRQDLLRLQGRRQSRNGPRRAVPEPVQMLVPGTLPPEVPGSAELQFHAQSDRPRRDGEFRDTGREDHPEPDLVGRASRAVAHTQRQAAGSTGHRGGASRSDQAMTTNPRFILAMILLPLMMAGGGDPVQAGTEQPRDHLRRAKIFLAAGDYRRALEACHREVTEAPSAQSYVYVTSVYQAIDGYLEHLAKADKWVTVEHLYLNLAGGDVQSLLDPPDVLARIAKEIIRGGVQKQSDVHAAMAARLDVEVTNRLWKEQAAWRAARPDSWWAGVPESWGW